MSALTDAPAGVNPRTVLLHGDPAWQIARATEGIVDVLFVGSRGHGPVKRVFAGSVSDALLLAATQPVVVLPRRLAAATAPGGSATAAP
jgi:nucleotide-binding universal stress UspA family protein